MLPDKTERLIFSFINETQLPDLLRIHNKTDNMRFISDGKYNWSQEELVTKYKRHHPQKTSGIGLFAVVLQENKKTIGEAGLFNSFNDKKRLELGYIIDTNHWGKGYGQELCNALINYAFHTLHCSCVVARMYANNTASVNLSEKCGMQLTERGKTKEGKEFLCYEKYKTTHSKTSLQ